MCLDFGTSALRAAVINQDDGLPIVLKLGMHLGEPEDCFALSIIYVRARENNRIYFGTQALRRVHGDGPGLGIFEQSPKMWLDSPEKKLLEDLACDTEPVSRFDLIVGLIAYALSGAMKCKEISSDLLDMVVRIAHPVWEAETWHRKKWLLEKALCEAIILASEFQQGLTVKKLSEKLRRIRRDKDIYLGNSSVDILEPSVAALHLFAASNNSRELCSIVDIGAGTTDIALLFFLTPDSDITGGERFQRKAISLAYPVSIDYAGNYVDKVLIRIIEQKMCKRFLDRSTYERDLGYIKYDIRTIKKQLFNSKSWTSSAGIEINLEELLNSEEILEMREIIANRFLEVVLAAKSEIKALYDVRVNYVRTINLAFAGGGAHLEFIWSCIPRTVDIGNGIVIPITLVNNVLELTDADDSSTQARLAVCAGGVTSASKLPTNNPNAKRFGLLDFGTLPSIEK